MTFLIGFWDVWWGIPLLKKTGESGRSQIYVRCPRSWANCIFSSNLYQLETERFNVLKSYLAKHHFWLAGWLANRDNCMLLKNDRNSIALQIFFCNETISYIKDKYVNQSYQTKLPTICNSEKESEMHREGGGNKAKHNCKRWVLACIPCASDPCNAIDTRRTMCTTSYWKAEILHNL